MEKLGILQGFNMSVILPDEPNLDPIQMFLSLDRIEHDHIIELKSL